MTAQRLPVVMAITGASGAVYSRRLLDCLVQCGTDVHLVISPYGQRLLADELDIHKATPEAILDRPSALVTVHSYRDVGSVLGSGSYLTGGMVICPCSSNTLGAVAAGLGDNLINRAAAVTLKEGRRLVVVHREMPMSRIELQNALRLNEAGAVICPAAPGFYLKPQSIDDLVDFVVGRVLDLLAIPHSLNIRWRSPADRS
ncbi:MAG: UbiX family flavin prenyltransferase [Planctomycetes bacterium]|nr:UbiX family flavin prenyltransferase [Planctomycetota bacterium]